jgi:HK97 family phage prohead protease
MQTRTISIDLTDRERKEAAASRRFNVSVSSEYPVTRRTYDGAWTEVLSHAAGAVDLSRAPLPVLESHDRSRVNIGLVSGLRLDGARLRGELVLGASQRAGELAQDIGAGIVTGLSIGYTVDKEERDEKKKTITARRWTPYEVSIVSVPADPSVGINRSQPMDNEQSSTSTTPTEETRVDPVELATRAERTRASEIHRLVRRARLGDALAERYIADGTSADDVRADVLERLVREDEATHISNYIPMEGERTRVTAGDNCRDDFHRAAIDSLLMRSGIHVAKPHAAAGDLSGSVHDLARLCVSRSGKSARGWLGEARGAKLIERAMTTSDFPEVVSAAVGASIRNGYEQEPASHRLWVRVQPVPDLNEQTRPILGAAPGLQPVEEHGEYTHGYMSEDAAKYTISKRGVIVALSWELMVNDRMGAFLRTLPALGQSARRAEADDVYGMFSLNGGAGPTMQDGFNLFDATNHANVTGAGAFNASLLGAGRALLRKMKSVGGGYLALQPRTLLVAPEQEGAAELLLADAARPAASGEKTTGAWVAGLQLAVEPRLPATAAYLLAGFEQIDHCELGVLEENVNGPSIEENHEFQKDVIAWRARHVFKAAFLDFRGAVRMPISG